MHTYLRRWHGHLSIGPRRGMATASIDNTRPLSSPNLEPRPIFYILESEGPSPMLRGLPRRLVVSCRRGLNPARGGADRSGRTSGRPVLGGFGRGVRDRTQAIEAMERYRRSPPARSAGGDAGDPPFTSGWTSSRRAVRVFGGDIVRETDGKTVLSLTGHCARQPSAFVCRAGRRQGAGCVRERDRQRPVGRAELVVLPKDDGTLRARVARDRHSSSARCPSCS